MRCVRVLQLPLAPRSQSPGPVVSARSSDGDEFEFLAGSARVDFRVRAAQKAFSSDGGAVQRATATLEKVRNLLFRQFGWGSA